MFRSRFLLFISLYVGHVRKHFWSSLFFFFVYVSWRCVSAVSRSCEREKRTHTTFSIYFLPFVDFSVHKTVIDFLLDWLLWPIFMAFYDHVSSILSNRNAMCSLASVQVSLSIIFQSNL